MGRYFIIDTLPVLPCDVNLSKIEIRPTTKAINGNDLYI
jgi:hypothetical protein